MARWQITVVIAGERQGEVTLQFQHTPITIGGSASNDVVLAGPHISRVHAIVTISGDHLVYQDRSRNGSFVNNQAVRETTLQSNDVVGVPPYRMTFTLAELSDEGTRPLTRASASQHPAGSHVSDVRREPPIAGATVAIAMRPAPTLRLVQAPAELLNRSFPLEEKERGEAVTIGRTLDADICLDIPSVSRQHATLKHIGRGRWRISDQGSRNGITVNGTKVDAAALASGDRITLGPDVTAVFEHSGGPHDPEPAQDLPDAEALTVTERRSSLDEAVMIVAVNGRIDGYNYAEFRERLNRLIDSGEHLLALDFSGCAFCDHVGLGVVLNTKTALDKHRGRLCLIGLDDRLREGIALLRLNSLLAIEEDEEAAVRRLRR
jgi:anti-anti-sigma factor